MYYKLRKCQRILAVLWMAFFLVTLIIIIVEADIGDLYVMSNSVNHHDAVYQWFLPTISPTCALVMGVLAISELNPQISMLVEKRRVTRFFLWLTVGLSLFYLTLVCALPLLTLIRNNADARIQLLRQSHFYLAPLQALLATALGVFFVSADERAPGVAAGG